MNERIVLVTGAARSGKSEWAESLAAKTSKSVVYVATSIINPEDKEWQDRILKHRQRRPNKWQTVSATHELSATITKALASECLLIDSLGTWVANLLELDADSWSKTSETLLTSLQTSSAKIILVAEETGWGVVPAYKSGRIFRDRLGDLIRQTGSIANTVYLVTGGHALNLSVLGTPLK
ncbi:bifunctional adenosylcobinamide kinase/adenosylcobinamide-phosphate guanylyltransferase [Myxosarcina sp. GI1]|uniref:bifunctional adenosylcobinamide kinase/adenosylcobinamide-phosphate guanylyltransferase n=1 Tax=Myxosarcina sp. GI1 TaxID=1541065 RepID=UPI00056D5BB9|nr:bifunctional adenosylcobinamide kinase/adenosylcobinamide-phosphate guanylyltransferase [Myxosarcina sp. GI1]